MIWYAYNWSMFKEMYRWGHQPSHEEMVTERTNFLITSCTLLVAILTGIVLYWVNNR